MFVKTMIRFFERTNFVIKAFELKEVESACRNHFQVLHLMDIPVAVNTSAGKGLGSVVHPPGIYRTNWPVSGDAICHKGRSHR